MAHENNEDGCGCESCLAIQATELRCEGCGSCQGVSRHVGADVYLCGPCGVEEDRLVALEAAAPRLAWDAYEAETQPENLSMAELAALNRARAVA